ncbi:MAG: hypothetical protein ACI9SP_004293 [Arenicella sp.]|jgi:hypothetical protein
MIKIKSDSAPILAASLSRCFSNTARVSDLLGVYKDTKNQDVLRMCVSFLHATVEDCMRNLVYFRLTRSKSKSVLNQVPLIGTSNTGRSEKFLLGELIRFENESVDSIIEKSICEYVNRLTFNNTNDIMAYVSQFNLDGKDIVPLLSDLDSLITRRHNIVHNSDFATNRSLLNIEAEVQLGTKDSYELEPIDSETVELWLSTTSKFFMQIIPLFLPDGESISLQNM